MVFFLYFFLTTYIQYLLIIPSELFDVLSVNQCRCERQSVEILFLWSRCPFCLGFFFFFFFLLYLFSGGYPTATITHWVYIFRSISWPERSLHMLRNFDPLFQVSGKFCIALNKKWGKRRISTSIFCQNFAKYVVSCPERVLTLWRLLHMLRHFYPLFQVSVKFGIALNKNEENVFRPSFFIKILQDIYSETCL